MLEQKHKGILIIECGDGRQQLLARAIRELQVFSEIVTEDFVPDALEENYVGIILAGDTGTGKAKELEEAFSELDIPVLILEEEDNTSLDKDVLTTFVEEVCNADEYWTVEAYAEHQIEEIRAKIGSKKVLCGLSGGVDSSVAALLVHKAIGDQLICVFVDHGLMRKDEGDQVEKLFKETFSVNLIRVNAEERFLGKLAGVTDPEKKRKIIGEEFVRVFEDEADKFSGCDYLVQGTIYPDVLESQRGDKLIKSHHNVGGLPEDMTFEGIVEPLRDLFKDEVRELGTYLGLPEDMVWRQPFPGPGLAVRCLGEVTKEKLDILREADAIFREEIAKAGLHRELSQYFAVLTDLRSVGVKDGRRSYDYVLGLRAVKTKDFMTAEWAKIPYEVLEKVSARITTEVDGVSRIVYEITGKPPATIEWE